MCKVQLCHEGKDSQGSYWKREVTRHKLQVTYWDSNDHIDDWIKVENFIVPAVKAFASQKLWKLFSNAMYCIKHYFNS